MSAILIPPPAPPVEGSACRFRAGFIELKDSATGEWHKIFLTTPEGGAPALTIGEAES